MKLGSNLVVLSCLPALTCALSASAQTDGGEFLEEIIVTAQKRSEDLQSVPMSVTAVTATQIESRRIFDPSQLQFVAPSLQLKSFNAAVGATNFAIRGVGTLSFANSIDASVTSVIDGVVMGRPEMGVMNFFDIEQIEVLNGPQGMLFGKNASAGLVNITTRRPVLGSFEGRVRGEYGSIDTPDGANQFLAQAVVNLPIGDTMAVRLSGSHTDNDPIIRNIVAAPGSNFGQQQSGFRGKLRWQPADSLEVSFGGDYTTSKGVGVNSAADRKLLAPNAALGIRGTYFLENQALGVTASPDNTLSSYGARTNLEFDVGGAQSTLNYTFDNGMMLTNIAAWRFFQAENIFDSDKHLVSLADVNSQKTDQTQYTEELRLTSPTGGFFDYQVGLFYYAGKIDGDFFALGNVTPTGAVGTPPTPFIGITGSSIETAMDSASAAIFGQGSLHLTDDFRLVLGARYTRDEIEQTITVLRSGAMIDPPLPPNAQYGVPSQSPSIEKDDLSWRASAQYDFTDDVMTYVTVAKGYKGPGYNLSQNPNLPPIKPEYAMLYEGGVKATLLDRRLLVNLSAYVEKFSDFQAQAFDVPSRSYIVQNAGDLTSRGGELQVNAIVFEGLSLSLGASYVDAYFSSYPNDRCYYLQPDCRPNGTVDSSGNPLPNAPRWTGTFGASYARQINAGLNAVAQLGGYSRTAINFNSNQDPNTRQGGYTLWDASLGIAGSSNAWSVSLFCRNCFDKRFVTFINPNSLSSPRADYYHIFGMNSFRTVGITAEAYF